MKAWAKAGLIGFIVVFVGLWALLFITGHDANGWKCSGLTATTYCDFITFLFSPIHLAFVLFFSWIGFIGGCINMKIINKIIRERGNESKIPLKITSTITLSLVIIFAIVGILVLENWVNVMIYAILFIVFALLISWIVGKWKYKH